MNTTNLPVTTGSSNPSVITNPPKSITGQQFKCTATVSKSDHTTVYCGRVKETSDGSSYVFTAVFPHYKPDHIVSSYFGTGFYLTFSYAGGEFLNLAGTSVVKFPVGWSDTEPMVVKTYIEDFAENNTQFSTDLYFNLSPHDKCALQMAVLTLPKATVDEWWSMVQKRF